VLRPHPHQGVSDIRVRRIPGCGVARLEGRQVFEDERLAGHVQPIANAGPEEPPFDRADLKAVAAGHGPGKLQLVEVLVDAKEGDAARLGLPRHNREEAVQLSEEIVHHLCILHGNRDVHGRIRGRHQEADQQPFVTSQEATPAVERSHGHSQETRQAEGKQRIRIADVQADLVADPLGQEFAGPQLP